MPPGLPQELERDERERPDEREPPDERDDDDRVVPDDRDDDERDARELPEARDDERDVRDPFDRDVERRPVRRSDAGISSVATALVSCGRSFCRNVAMRSSCLRNSRASFSVSLSPTVCASVSIAT